MMISNRLAVLAVCLAMLSPLPAAADHETQSSPTQEPLRTPGSDGAYFTMALDFGTAANIDTDADFGADTDWQFGMEFGVGYRLGIVRLEAELYSRDVNVGSLDLGAGSPFPLADYNGTVWTSGLMGNVYIELPAGGSMRPYLGVGYGLSRVSATYNESICFIICFATDNVVLEDYDIVRARQLLFGASFPSQTEVVEYFVGYRYFETDDLDLTTEGGFSYVQRGIRSHTISGGVRFPL